MSPNVIIASVTYSKARLTFSCLKKVLKRHVCFNKPILYEVYCCIDICMSEYSRTEMVKTFTAEATSLKVTFTSYVFETFLQVVEMITS